MSGNTFGTLFTLTTFGESHGPAIGCVVDGCPPGMELSQTDIQPDLDRRRPGSSRYTTQRRESDEVEILSGVFEGKTTGAPIGMLIKNTDQRSRDYSKIAEQFRPGHADYTYSYKYGIRDYRGGGRSSARETALRVAAGAIAKKYLAQKYNVTIRGCVSQIGELKPHAVQWDGVENNPFFWPCVEQVDELEKLINQIRKQGDSIGACVLVEAHNVPPGWGEPIYQKLDTQIAAAMMGINAVKAVAIGAGFDCVSMKGSEYRDELSANGFHSNKAGGIAGGISTGQPITANVAFKPTSSIVLPGKTIDSRGREVEVSVTGRHDPCVGLRAVPIVEAMMALVLVDLALVHRGKYADVAPDAPEISSDSRVKARQSANEPVQSSFEASGED